MTYRTLIARSLRFHARAHLGVLLGAAVGSAALTGALLVGDSVRESLRGRALERLANTYFALAPADRFFSRGLEIKGPWSIASAKFSPNGRLIVTTVPNSWPQSTVQVDLLALRASVSKPTSDVRANDVQILGIDKHFSALAGANILPLPKSSVLI